MRAARSSGSRERAVDDLEGRRTRWHIRLKAGGRDLGGMLSGAASPWRAGDPAATCATCPQTAPRRRPSWSGSMRSGPRSTGWRGRCRAPRAAAGGAATGVGGGTPGRPARIRHRRGGADAPMRTPASGRRVARTRLRTVGTRSPRRSWSTPMDLPVSQNPLAPGLCGGGHTSDAFVNLMHQKTCETYEV